MAEDDPLGIAGTARSVLQEGDIRGHCAIEQGEGLLIELSGRQDLAQSRRRCSQEGANAFRFRHRDDEHRFRVGQDAGMPAQVVGKLRQTSGRIDRHRNAASEHHAEETRQVVAPGRQHQGNRLLWPQTTRDQARRDTPRRAQQIAVRQRLRPKIARLARPARVEQHVRTIRAALGVPLENLDQGRCLHRDFAGLTLRRFVERDDGRLLQVACPIDQAPQVGRCFSFSQSALGQRLAKLGGQSQQQFDPRQAIQAQVAFKMATQADSALPPGTRLLDHRRDELQQALGRSFRQTLTGCPFAVHVPVLLNA